MSESLWNLLFKNDIYLLEEQKREKERERQAENTSWLTHCPNAHAWWAEPG